MQLSTKHAISLIAAFILVCTTFLLVQHYGVDLIRLSYDGCHFLYGLAFPMAFGFIYLQIPAENERVPLQVLISQMRAITLRKWPHAIARSIRRDLQQGFPWSPWAGALWITTFSITNEVVIDPITNGIPFMSAYSNLVADLCGVATFLVITHLVTRGLSTKVRLSHPCS